MEMVGDIKKMLVYIIANSFKSQYLSRLKSRNIICVLHNLKHKGNTYLQNIPLFMFIFIKYIEVHVLISHFPLYPKENNSVIEK